MRSAASQVCQLDEGREVPRDIRAIHVRFERAEIDGMTGLTPSKVLFGQRVRTAIASSLSPAMTFLGFFLAHGRDSGFREGWTALLVPRGRQTRHRATCAYLQRVSEGPLRAMAKGVPCIEPVPS